MAHCLSINKKGRAEMFSGRNITPWHRLGTVVDGLLKAEEAIKAASLDWTVEKHKITADFHGRQIPCPRNFALCRSDSGAVLSVMGKAYTPIQNSEAFEFFDSVVGSGQAVYDTAGALHGGKRVWIMARLPKRLFVANGDELEKNILLTNSHDGSSTLQMMHVGTRVVCQNTLNIALREATHTVSIRHRANFKDRLAEAQRALDIADGYFEDLAGLINKLAAQPMGSSEMRAFTEKLIPEPERTVSSTARSETKAFARVEKVRDELVSLFSRGTGNLGKTRWDALNAVTEFVDHHRKPATNKHQSDESERRFTATLFGSGADLKQQAVALLN
jgi:phage/plasmid-like protein (TIGR03299 family)